MPKNPNRVAAGKRAASHATPKTCPYCRGDFLGTNKQRYCSRACKEAAELADRSPRACPVCSAAIEPAGKTGRVPVYCSESCKKIARYPSRPRACVVCGTDFTPPRGSGKAITCGPACKTVRDSALAHALRRGTPGQQAARLAAELEKRDGESPDQARAD